MSTLSFVSKRKYDLRTQIREYCNGTTITSEESLEQSGRDVVENYIHDRRLRPDDLVGHPTALPEAYILKQRYLKYVHEYRYNGTSKCLKYPNRLRAVLTQHYASYGTAISSPATPLTGWETKARNKLKDDVVNLGEHLAELRETMGVAKDGANYLKDLVNSFRKKRRRRKISMNAVPATVLVTDLAVMPIVNDIAKAMEILRLRLERPIYSNVYVRKVVKDKRRWKEDEGLYLDFYINEESRYEQYTKLRAKLIPKVLSPVEFGDLPTILWEKFPASFFIDQIINVGEILGALDALDGVDSIIGTQTHKWFIKRTAEMPYYGSYPTYYYQAESNPEPSTFESHQRTIIDSIPNVGVLRYEPSDSWRALRDDLSALWLSAYR